MFNIFKSSTKEYEGKNFYSFCARNSNGEEIPMNSYLGKVVLVVNVASQYDEAEPSALNFPTTGLADENFKQLNELDKRYRDQGLVILGFPTNQFSGKEPTLQEEIVSFIKRKYNVDFEIYEKLDVNGANTHPLFEYLKNILTGTITNDLKWHFTKFIIDRNGNPVKRYAPNDPPFSFEEEIRHLLRQECVFKPGMEGQQQQQERMVGQSSASGQQQPLRKEEFVKEKGGIGLQSEKMKEERRAPGEESKHEKTEYKGQVGQTPFGLQTEKHKEVQREGGEQREYEQKNLQAGRTTMTLEKEKREEKPGEIRGQQWEQQQQQGDIRSKEQWTKEQQDLGLKDQGDKGKLGEGGMVGAQFGIHVCEHKIQTGIQAGRETKEQEYKK